MKNQEFSYNTALVLRPHRPRNDNAPVAQLDRVPGYELGGRTFESCRVRHTTKARFMRAFFVCLTQPIPRAPFERSEAPQTAQSAAPKG